MSWFRFILLWLVILSTITFWGLQRSGSCYCGWLYCLPLPQGLVDELVLVHIFVVGYFVNHYFLRFTEEWLMLLRLAILSTFTSRFGRWVGSGSYFCGWLFCQPLLFEVYRGVAHVIAVGYIVYFYLKVWQMSWLRFILLSLVTLSIITVWGFTEEWFLMFWMN